MRVITCDKCGKPADPPGLTIDTPVVGREGRTDLCFACRSEFFAWIRKGPE